METSLYEQLGGATGVRALVHRFYQHMATREETKGILALHPADLASSEEKLFCFLSGWTGGPNLFIERFGHPMLRARHLPFSIGKSERDQWMLCMVLALEEHPVSEETRELLIESFLRLADHMRNRAEG